MTCNTGKKRGVWKEAGERTSGFSGKEKFLGLGEGKKNPGQKVSIPEESGLYYLDLKRGGHGALRRRGAHVVTQKGQHRREK